MTIYTESKKDSIINMEYVHTVLRERQREVHKGDCGNILVIAGSKGMTGAAILCARGAYRSGAGLVSVSIDEEFFPIIQVAVPEATCVSRQLFQIDLSKYDAIAIGPGLGDDDINEGIIEAVFHGFKGTVVMDADGLNTIAREKLYDILRNTTCRVIITPHIGEAARLLEISRDKIETMDRKLIAKSLIEKTETVVVLKGADTIVASQFDGSYTNTTGNPGMATGGSGDVLTGIIASLAGQGLSPVDAARVGVFAHGIAGDIAAERYSENGLIAGDVADMTAVAIKRIVGK